jgi:hypothetical protein
MKVCLSEIANKFYDFNLAYFNGILPKPNFELIDSFKYFGYFECEKNGGVIYNPTIKISKNYDYTSEQLKNILVHEMLHYYLAYIRKDVKVKHGKAFRMEANMLNEQYRLNITEEINMNEYQRCQDTSAVRYFFSKLF